MTIHPEVSERGHSIDRIVVPPLLVTIYTSYPDIYLKRDSIDYLVQCFSDKSELPVAGNGTAGATAPFLYVNDNILSFGVSNISSRYLPSFLNCLLMILSFSALSFLLSSLYF